MPNTITVKIDVAKIDKARLFTGKTNAAGHTPKYLDLVLIPRKETGQYGDTHLVKQSISKEEREAKLEMPILGSATERGSQAQAPRPAAAPKPAAVEDPGLDADVPF